MKIAITGHTAGIGQALAKEYALDGHEIVGLSQREGNNIRNTPKICDQIEPCDIFINNAQAGYAQTELLFEMARRWQKVTLEEAVSQIRHRRLGLTITIVRPGNIATSLDKTVPPAADVNNWARTLLDLLDMAKNNDLSISDISLGPLNK